VHVKRLLKLSGFVIAFRGVGPDGKDRGGYQYAESSQGNQKVGHGFSPNEFLMIPHLNHEVLMNLSTSE
jgi:hypothetical protein